MNAEAIAQCDTVLLDLKPEFDPWMRSTLAAVYALAGRSEPGLRTLDSLANLSAIYDVNPACYATIYASLNETELALDWLKIACDAQSENMLFLRVPGYRDFFYRSIRTDPRYLEMIEKMHYPPISPVE